MEGRQRAVSELIARYKLEPSVRDIYVEGPTDKRLFDWFLRNTGIRTAGVYCADTVSIPRELLAKYNETAGSKGQLLVLAGEIVSQLGDTKCFTCVVDADFDRVLNRLTTNPTVLATDFTCIEMYTFCEEVMDQWLSLVAKVPDDKSLSVLTVLGGILREVFLARLADRTLGWSMEWISIGAGLPRRHKKVDEFSMETFVQKLLLKNGRIKEKDRFNSEMETYRGKLPADFRHSTHGHDFTELLAEYARRRSKERWLHTVDGVVGSLFAAISLQILLKHNMFVRIQERGR